MSLARPLAAVLLVVLAAGTGRADGPAGRWKLRLPVQQDRGTVVLTMLLSLSESDGKWVGDFIDSSPKFPQEPKFSGLEVKGDAVKFGLALGGQEFLAFEGVVAKDGKKLAGSYSRLGSPLQLVELRSSKLKKLDDPFEVAREIAAQTDSGADLFDAGFLVLTQAAAKKVPAEEVRGMADKLAKAAAEYGPRWERTVAVKLAATLAGQAGFADVALAQARRAERMLADDAPAGTQMEVFDTLATALTTAGKADEAKKYVGMVRKLEAKDYAEYQKTALGFTPDPFKGRKGKGDRVVLFELFTGSEAPPAAAAELAAQGLLRTFKPTEVIVLEYHLPAGAPDPLTCPDGLERLGTYAEVVRTVPVILVNGKSGPRGGGPASGAKDKYADYREVAVEQLETPAKAKLTLTAAPAEKGFTAKATVADLENPGEKVVLRFVLAEEKVRFPGASGVRYHTMVVRAMPGGAKGFPLTKKAAEQTVTIDPAEVREKLAKYLDEYARTEAEFPRADRPLALTGLKLVALVQNDATGEVLQAAQVDLK